MPRVLVLFAHPALERSRCNRRLIRGIERLSGVTFHDLYEAYPDLHLDVRAEQELLATARALIQEIERVFQVDVEEAEIVQRDRGWDASELRQEVRATVDSGKAV